MIDVTPTGLVVTDIVPGLTMDELVQLTGVPLRNGVGVKNAA